MLHWRWQLCLAVALTATLCAAVERGGAASCEVAPAACDPPQDAAEPAEPPVAPARPMPRVWVGEVKEHPPLHVQEKDGTLVPVLGFSLDDFDELIERGQANRGPMRPKYTLSRLTATGKAGQQFAELQLDFEILLSAPGWVRVPLRLGEGVLLHQAYRGPGKHSLEFEGSAAGYVVWLEGESDQPHQLSLKLIAPVSQQAGRQRLRLTAPRSTQSALKISVPLAAAQSDLIGGAMLDPGSPPKPAGSATELSLVALDGVFDLSWWPAEQRIVEATPDLDAVGAILTRVDGRTVRTEATLTLRSTGGDYKFQKFRVRVPRGATLTPTDQPGVKLTGPGTGPNARMVDVELDAPTAGPVELRLVAQRNLTPGKQDEIADLAGIEVVDALRQSGHIAVDIADDWQVTWEKAPPTVRRVDTLPEALRLPDVIGFEYSGAAVSLPARVDRRPTRIQVEPDYLVRVEVDRIHLSARLKYRLPGAKVYQLEVDLTGWETDADRVGPANLVDQAQLAPQKVSPLVIPLQASEMASRQEFELQIEAWRAIAAGSESIEFQLPLPKGNQVEKAPVVILPADNVSLSPRSEALMGLEPQPFLRRFSLPPRQQEPLYYLQDAVQGRFAADFRRMPGSISVAVESEVSLDSTDVRVEQKLHYKVAREAIPYLTLEVPVQLADTAPIEAAINGRVLTLVRITDEPATPEEPVLMRAGLVDDQGKPADRIGSFTLLVRYSLPREPLAGDGGAALQLPLVIPHEGTLKSHDVVTKSPAGTKLELKPADGPWKVRTPVKLEAAPLAQFATAERVRGIGFLAKMEASRPDDATIVERAWIQSELGLERRYDRAVFRLTTPRERLDLTLPRGVVLGDVQVLVNGQGVASQVSGNRVLSISLPKESARRAQVLEVMYRFPNRPPRGANFTLEAPQWDSSVLVRRLYWQLVLPPDEHLFGLPADFASESVWTWRGFYFARQPLLEQADLESWCGPSTTHRDGISSAANVYLFSSLGNSTQLPVWTAGRTRVVFAASLGALLLGLLLIYLPSARRVLLLAAAVAVIAFGLVYPEPAVLVLQAGSLGLGLALLAGLLRRAVLQPRRPGVSSMVRQPSSSIVERAAAPALQPLASGPHSSTRTAAAIAAPGDAGEAES